MQVVANDALRGKSRHQACNSSVVGLGLGLLRLSKSSSKWPLLHATDNIGVVQRQKEDCWYPRLWCGIIKCTGRGLCLDSLFNRLWEWERAESATTWCRTSRGNQQWYSRSDISYTRETKSGTEMPFKITHTLDVEYSQYPGRVPRPKEWHIRYVYTDLCPIFIMSCPFQVV